MGSWKQARWLVVDTETTGLVAGPDRIVELAGLTFESGVCQERCATRINPGIPIPAEASALHGIKDEDVKDAPAIGHVAPGFLRRVCDADVLVGYNWPFDAGFLLAELGDAWTEAIATKPIVDPLVIVRFDGVGRFWRGKGRHKLTAVCERMGVQLLGAHGASADAHATGHLLGKLLHHLPDDAREASELIARERQVQDEAFERWRAAQPAREA